MTTLSDQVAGVMRRRGLVRFDAPVVLASGETSREFLDAKAALSRGEDLGVACRALLELLADVEFDAVGGMTMGADQFAHVIAVEAGKEWFVVRKQPKGRGTDKLVEGANVGPGWKVVVVDDVVTTGGSIRRACEVVQGLGATVACAVALVDRGDSAAAEFESSSIPYRPLLTYRDLEIDPVGPTLAR
jgi:orotate phosphoribosyltransferase